MVRKSYGKMRGTRSKMAGRSSSISKFIDKFEVGESVHIDFSSHRIPHPKFQGFTGRVVEKTGKGYVVEVMNRNAVKKISLKPEHLKR